MVLDVPEPVLVVLANASSRDSDCRLTRAAVYHPARLRASFVLSQSPTERCTWLICAACSRSRPISLWRRSHSRHHASSGDLHHRGHGDVWVLTVDEYFSRSFWARLQYRLYRHPLFLFVIGPSLLFIVRQRVTYKFRDNWRRERRSVHLTNLGILAMIAVAWCTIGLTPFLLVHLPVVVLAASIGSWLFFVQHQYERSVLAAARSLGFCSFRVRRQLLLPLAARCCNGSLAISAFITSIIWKAGYRTTICR